MNDAIHHIPSPDSEPENQPLYTELFPSCEGAPITQRVYGGKPLTLYLEPGENRIFGRGGVFGLPNTVSVKHMTVSRLWDGSYRVLDGAFERDKSYVPSTNGIQYYSFSELAWRDLQPGHVCDFRSGILLKLGGVVVALGDKKENQSIAEPMQEGFNRTRETDNSTLKLYSSVPLLSPSSLPSNGFLERQLVFPVNDRMCRSNVIMSNSIIEDRNEVLNKATGGLAIARASFDGYMRLKHGGPLLMQINQMLDSLVLVVLSDVEFDQCCPDKKVLGYHIANERTIVIPPRYLDFRLLLHELFHAVVTYIGEYYGSRGASSVASFRGPLLWRLFEEATVESGVCEFYGEKESPSQDSGGYEVERERSASTFL